MTNESPSRWPISVGASIFIAFSTLAAHAGEMTLTSADGTVRFTGEFLRLEGLSYVIEVNGNEVAVPAFEVNCEGEDCLNFPPLPPVQPENG